MKRDLWCIDLSRLALLQVTPAHVEDFSAMPMASSAARTQGDANARKRASEGRNPFASGGPYVDCGTWAVHFLCDVQEKTVAMDN